MVSLCNSEIQDVYPSELDNFKKKKKDQYSKQIKCGKPTRPGKINFLQIKNKDGKDNLF